jgi:disulfide bond formation protein DsbB
MENYLGLINKTLSFGTIFLQLTIVFLVFNLIFFNKTENKILSFFKKFTLPLGFLMALGAFSLSLFYSEIIGYPPCTLCWVQRIFLYPQLILFGLAWYKKENAIIDFSLVFAIFGSVSSLYHMYVEAGGKTGLACANPASGEVSCAVRYLYEFNYVTLPLMALTLSLFIITILLNYKYSLKK